MNNKKRLWVVSEMFYPDETATSNIMTQIAKSLSEMSIVNVLCGPIGYDFISNEASWDSNSIKIYRVRIPNFNKNVLFFRIIRFLFLSLGMFCKGLFLIKKTDRVLIVTNPAFNIPLFSLIKILKRNKYFILVHDVFPENLLAADLLKRPDSFYFRLIRRVYNWSYCKADSLIVLGRDMKEVMQKKTKYKKDIEIIENWGDTETISIEKFENNTLIQKLNLQDKIVFMFAGNIGRVQGLEYFFKVIQKVDNSLIHFLFIGSGSNLNSLKKTFENNKNVTFLNYIPRSEQNTFLNACHVGVVTLSPKLYGLGVPSKTYNIMAAGKPILFLGNKKTEVALMLHENECGYVFAPEEEDQLLNFFQSFNKNSLIQVQLKGLKARHLSETRYSKEKIIRKLENIIFKNY
ncbi:MAG: glycosyltransferase family 4 protein [Bacteroidota bacterium]|nr:glycosyltransferase family 4 protein [Bacteroidota bacterium]